MMKQPSSDDLKCLNCWPLGSKGESQEQAAIDILLQVAKYVGFGRMTQLAEGIEEIWRDPETAIPKYQEIRKEHFRNCGYEESSCTKTEVPVESCDGRQDSTVRVVRP